MRLLFLSKRSPQQRDLIDRPYGRFFHLPAQLAALGHSVSVALIGHDGRPGAQTHHAGVSWLARDLRAAGPTKALGDLAEFARAAAPEWVIACSDAWVACLGAWMAKRIDARLAVDAYDDFEAYMPWNVPLHFAYRRVVARAELVTAAGPQLARHLQRHRDTGAEVAVLPMAADPAFEPMDRDDCRRRLGLPLDLPLMGYSGGWASNRGTQMIVPTLEAVRRRRPEAKLVLTGKPPAAVASHPGAISLGYVDDALLPRVVNSVDVSCIVTADSRFGRHSYPAKLCEAMACNVPVVATATAPVAWMLARSPERVVPLADVAAFSESVVASFGEGRIDYGTLPTWASIATDMQSLLAA